MDLEITTKSHKFATIEMNTVELPPCIEIKESSVISGVAGAFSKMLIPKDTRFGPYKGKTINAGQKDYIDYRFAWEVFEKDSDVLKYTIDAMDSRTSNWMRHVNCARFFEEQNIISTQDGYSIYYVAMKDIKPGEELLTWFDPKLLKRTKRRLSKMERKPVGYTIELVPWSDEKKFVPEIIETKRARKKKVLSDMISLDENPLVLTRTLQRLSKLSCTSKQLTQSRGISTSEHKNVCLAISKSRSIENTEMFLTAKTTGMTKGPGMVKGSITAIDQSSSHILKHSTKSTHQNLNEGKMLHSDNSFCLAQDTVTLIAEKGKSLLSSHDIVESCLKVKKKKGKANIGLLRKRPIKVGKSNNYHSCDGEIVNENVTSVKPIIFTQNNDGSTSVEDHDEMYTLSNVELMPECDDKCLCLDNKKSVRPYCSVKEKQDIFVIQFTLQPEHKSLSPDNKIIYRCDICDSAYNHAFSLKRHYLSVHVNHRYLSKEDIISCQIETFHAGIELDSKDSQIEIQTSSWQSKKSPLLKEQLSVPEINLSDFDQIDANTYKVCIDKFQGKAVLEDKYLKGEVLTPGDKNNRTFDSGSKVIDRAAEFTTVQSLTYLAQMSLDKAKSKQVALNNSRKLSVLCEQIKHHSSEIDNGIQMKCNESVGSDLQCLINVEEECVKENKAAPKNATFCFMNVDNSIKRYQKNDLVDDLEKNVQKPDLEVAKFDETVGSRSMLDVVSYRKMHEKDSSASVIGSVQQSAHWEAVKRVIDSTCSTHISKTMLDINSDASGKCCTNDISSTMINSNSSFDSYSKNNMCTSTLFRQSLYGSNHNMGVKEIIETQENCIDKVCTALSLQEIFEEDIVKSDFEEGRIVSQLNDSDIVHHSSTEIKNNGVKNVLAKTVTCSATLMTKTSPLDSHNLILAENNTTESVIKVNTSTFSETELVNKENNILPIMISHTLQEEAYKQSHTLSQHADDKLSESNTEYPVKHICSRKTMMSNNQDNFSGAIVDSFGSLLPVTKHSSPSVGDNGISLSCSNLHIPAHSSKVQRKVEKFDADIILPEKSMLQNTVSFPVSTVDSSSTPSITFASSAITQNQPLPPQLIFVTNIVFPVVSPVQKQMTNSMSPLSSAVSQSSSPITDQTAMAGLTASVPLVVISQVPCGVSIQNAASALLQSTTSRKTLQSIKRSLNVLNLGNTTSWLPSSSLLSSGSKSPTATVVCGSSSLENSAPLGGLASTTNPITLTSSSRNIYPSKSEHTDGKPFKPASNLNYSSPRTTVSSLVYGPCLPISNTGSNKSVTVVSKIVIPANSSFISPKKNHTHLSVQPDDLYRCHMCVLVFKTMSELKLHIKNDPHRFKGGIKQYACLQCSMRFSNKNNLMRHNLMNHPENENYKFRCFTCGKGFMSETYLKMHARFHSGKNFPCKYGCVDKYFPNAASLVKHLRTQHAGLNLKEYLRNAKAEQTRRKKLNCKFEAANKQVSSLGIERKTLGTNKTVVTSLVQCSLDQPSMELQEKHGRPKGSKNSSKDFKQVFSKVEDKTVKPQELEFLPETKDSCINEEKNKLHFVCNFCLQKLSSHLKLLQHRTQSHGVSQSVQEYLYQMSKETVDDEILCVKQEFSPPPSPKTFFENVNRRSYDNIKHYIDGNSESLEFWQKHLIVEDSTTKCVQVLATEPKKKLEWTVFNFPPCFEYKEDCTMFYDRTTQLETTHKLSVDLTENKKEKNTLNLYDVSGIKSDAEMDTLSNTLEHKESVCEKFVNECTNISFENKKVFSNKNSTDSHDDSMYIGSKLHHKLTSHIQEKIKRELKSNSDVMLEVDNCEATDNKMEVDNCEATDNKMNVSEDLPQNIMHTYDNLVDNLAYLSNSACSREDDYFVKSGVASLTHHGKISDATKRENYSLCRCIVNETVSSALILSKSINEMKHSLHKTQPFFNENDDVETFQSEVIEGTLIMSGDSLLDLVVVPNINDIKIDGNKQETNTVEIVKTAPINSGTFSETIVNQHIFTNLSVREKLQTLKSQYMQGLNLAISKLKHDDCISSFSSINIIHPPSVFLLDALDLHIMEKQLSSKMFKKMLCSSINNVSSLVSTGFKTLSLEPLVIVPEAKLSLRHFDRAAVTSLNISDSLKHDQKRYSIWAGQVQQNIEKTTEEEIFCQPVTEAVRKQGIIHQQVKYKFDKSKRYKEICDKHEATQICFAEGLGLMTRKEFELSYHAQKQQEFVIKVPEIWENYENVWFGKKGNITVVCSICHRHFTCWDLCFRHQLKKHPHIEPASLEMEKDNYVEDMYYYYPMPYGILAQTHLIPDNLPAPEVYVCTKCGFPFKNLNRLHAHIIVCGPAPEEITNRNDSLKNPSYMKKKLLPIMDRRNQNLEEPKIKVGQPFKSFVYSCTPSVDTKHSTSFLSKEKGNKLSLPSDNKLLSSSLQSRSSYFGPFSFYSGKKTKNYELLYNPQNHTRRREMYKVLDQHQCHGCNLKFNSLSMLERHVNKCSGKDKLQSQKPLLSGIMSVDAALRKQHTCRYCNKRFTYIKGVDLHYKRICAVRKVKEEENQLTGEDLAHEAELKKIIEHIKWSKSLNKDSSDIIQGHVIVEDDGTLTRVVKQRGSPQSLKKKMKKKSFKWTALKRHRLDEDMSSASSNAQSSPITFAEDIQTDMKVSEKFKGVLVAKEQKRLTRSSNQEVVNQNCENTIIRQILADRCPLRRKRKTASQPSLTAICRSVNIVPVPASTKEKNHGKKGKIKKFIFDKIHTSENRQNRTNAKSATKSRANVDKGCLFSVSSPKTFRRASDDTSVSSASAVDTCIKPPARKRGKPQKYDPSDMESNYKKKKNCDQGYMLYQRRANIAKNNLNGRKRSRSDTSFGGSSQKRQKADMVVKVSNYDCESYVIRNETLKRVLEHTTSSQTQTNKYDSSRKDEKSDKNVHNIETSKLLAKIKHFNETAKSKRNRLHQGRKYSSSFASGDTLNNKELSHICFNKKVCVDSKLDKKCCRSIKKKPSLELLKHLTKNEKILIMNNSPQKSALKVKRNGSAYSLPVEPMAAVEKHSRIKHLKITTLNTSGKGSVNSSVPNDSTVMSGLRTLTETTLGKAKLKLGGESHNNFKKSNQVTIPVMSNCSIPSTPLNMTASVTSSNDIFKPSSPLFKQPVGSVRIVTLSPNGTNLMTFDSVADVPQSSLLLGKSSNFTPISLPSPNIMNKLPGCVPLFKKSSVTLPTKELLKTTHDPCTEKHATSNSESSGIIHRDHAQTVSRLTMTKNTMRIKESIVPVNSHIHVSQKGPANQSSISDNYNKLGLTSHIVYDCENKEKGYTTKKQLFDNQNRSYCKSDGGLVIKVTNASESCVKENCALTMDNFRVPVILSSTESSSTGCSDEIIPKLAFRHDLKQSLGSEITLLDSDKQANIKEMRKTSKTDNKTCVRRNQNKTNFIPQALTAMQHISHCHNRQNTQKSKRIHSVRSSESKPLYMTPVQSTCTSKCNVANSSSLINCNERVPAIIVPSTSVKAQVTVPRVISNTAVASLTYPARFESPAKIITVTGNVIQRGTQTSNKMLKLGTGNSLSSFMEPAQLQTESIRAHSQQIPSASHSVLTNVSTKYIPRTAPKLFATEILTQCQSAQRAVTKNGVAHSLLNIGTNITTHLPTTRQLNKTFSQPICGSQSDIVNNTVSVSQPSDIASIESSVSASTIKADKPSNISVAVPSNAPATNKIMFSLDDGTTAMLDPDSLAQFLSISPSLTKTDLCSVASITNVVSVGKSTGVLNITQRQLNQSSGDEIN